MSELKRRDRAFVLEAVRADGRALLFADPTLQNDREVWFSLGWLLFVLLVY